MSDLTASEVIGELRKAARQYEIFKKAEEIVQVLVEQEQRRFQLNKEVASLETEKLRVDKQIDERIAKAEEHLEAALKAVKDADAEAAKVKAEAHAVLEQAKKDASEMINKAGEKVAAADKELAHLDTEIKAAKEEVESLAKVKDGMLAEMKAKRDELLKVLN